MVAKLCSATQQLAGSVHLVNFMHGENEIFIWYLQATDLKLLDYSKEALRDYVQKINL